MKLPEYYRHPERYKCFILHTCQGIKRTFAKNKEEAIAKIEKKGFKILKLRRF